MCEYIGGRHSSTSCRGRGVSGREIGEEFVVGWCTPVEIRLVLVGSNRNEQKLERYVPEYIMYTRHRPNKPKYKTDTTNRYHNVIVIKREK